MRLFFVDAAHCACEAARWLPNWDEPSNSWNEEVEKRSEQGRKGQSSCRYSARRLKVISHSRKAASNGSEKLLTNRRLSRS